MTYTETLKFYSMHNIHQIPFHQAILDIEIPNKDKIRQCICNHHQDSQHLSALCCELLCLRCINRKENTLGNFLDRQVLQDLPDMRMLPDFPDRWMFQEFLDRRMLPDFPNRRIFQHLLDRWVLHDFPDSRAIPQEINILNRYRRMSNISLKRYRIYRIVHIQRTDICVIPHIFHGIIRGDKCNISNWTYVKAGYVLSSSTYSCIWWNLDIVIFIRVFRRFWGKAKTKGLTIPKE